MSRSMFVGVAVVAITLGAAAPAAAQRRPRARVSSVVWVGGGWYAPRFILYDPYWHYGTYRYDRRSALRIDAAPRYAQVFVDGYDAGIVDEFDGIFQRLYLEPGGHEITIYLAGYRTHTERLYVRPGDDHRMRVQLEPLSGGETAEPPQMPYRASRTPSERREPPVGVDPVDRPGAREPRGRFGTLSLHVQPADAEVYVDGERWAGGAESGRIAIRLTEGRHRLEVRKAGMRTFTEEVLVRFGRTISLNVSLSGG